ncbi:MAG: hypothetical protein ACXWCS_25840 [Burkholderiales bacterium]
MAEVLPRRPSEPHTRRRGSIRGKYSPHSVLGVPAPVAIERRKKKPAGFDIAAALEANLDRYPTKEDLWQLLTSWMDAAKREGLGARHPDYLKALERAMVVMANAPTATHAITVLHAR